MKILSHISIYRKLVFIQMITALCVVLLVTGTFVYVNFNETRASKIENMNSLASVIARNSSSALVFNDDQTATEILGDLNTKKDISAAEIIDKNGKTFAFYSRDKNFVAIRFAGLVKKQAHQFRKDELLVSNQIHFDGELIGYVLLKAKTNDLKAYLLKRINIAGLVTVIGIILAFVLATILQNYISKPIYSLLNVMNIVKNTSNYGIRSNIDSKDEIGNLSRVFNQMINEIEKKDHQLLNSNLTLQEKVKERTQELENNYDELKIKNEEIADAKNQAEQSKAVKELFLANMSHEIRTPLNAIIGFQQLLRKTNLDENQKEYVAAIDFAGNNLLSLVNDILDLSKIESGKLHFESRNFVLEEQMRQVMELLQQRANNKQIGLFLNMDERIPTCVFGDSVRFNQILLNLIGNAIKFTHEGEVEVYSKLISLDEDQVRCRFEVRDSGIGISEKQVHRIFERFTQAGTDTTRLYGGTGLGLTISKHLVEQFGGKLEVSSKEGIGSVFAFDLYFGRCEEEPDVVEVKQKEVKKLDRKLTILLAEDVIINQRLMLQMAKAWSYELDIAPNGLEALKLVQNKTYDVVLMDIQMPEMNGLEATKAIRKLKDPIKSIIPIVALTAHASNTEAEKCLKVGMNAYVTKPFEQNHLLEVMHKLVLEHEALIESENEGKHQDSQVDRGFISLETILSHAEGDETYVDEMIAVYLENMPVYLKDLEALLVLGNPEEIYAQVHTIKSPLALFQVKEGLNIVTRIEKSYKLNQITNAWFVEVKVLIPIIERSINMLQKMQQARAL